MTSRPSPPLSEDFADGIAAASTLIQKFTYPLLRLDEKKLPVVFASCVFLRVEDKVYLVTAAHALRRNPTGLWTRGKKCLFEISGRATVSRGDLIDHFDIGSVRIDDHVVQEQGIEVIPWSNLSSVVEVSNPHSRAICGFPVSMNKQAKSLERSTNRLTCKCYTYFGFAEYQGDFSSFGKSSTVHVGLDYLSGVDDRGRSLSSPPSPRGISGGGAWLVPDLHQSNLIFLEGIFIECHPVGKPRYAFSTRLEHVLDFVSQTHNE